MHGTPLDGHARSGHSSGLETPAMGTMDDRRGRYAAYTARLVDTVVTQPGHTPPELRRAVLERAFGPHPLSKPETSSPLSGTERGTGDEDHTGERETVLYRPEFFGRAMCDWTQAVMRGPSAWSVGERELFAAFTSRLNQCVF